MRDDNGVAQLWLISPQGGEPRQLTHHATGVQSAFNWHPSGKWLGLVLENRIACCDAQSGRIDFLTAGTTTRRRRTPSFFTGWATRRMDGRGERVPSAMGDGNRAINQGGGIFAGDDGIGHFRLLLAFLDARSYRTVFAEDVPRQKDRIHHGGKRHIRDGQRFGAPVCLIVTDHRSAGARAG